MTTLHDQIVIRERPMFSPAEMAERGIVAQTVLSAKLGMSGTERHAIWVTIWEATPARPHPDAGQVIGGHRMPEIIPAKPRRWSGDSTYCGSQRFRSGAHSYSATLPVTCERCLSRVVGLITDVYPEDVLEDDPRYYFRPK